MNDSQATNKISTSRKSTCARRAERASLENFRIYIRSKTPISFSVGIGTYGFCLRNITCFSVTLLHHIVHAMQFPFDILLI